MKRRQMRPQSGAMILVAAAIMRAIMEIGMLAF